MIKAKRFKSLQKKTKETKSGLLKSASKEAVKSKQKNIHTLCKQIDKLQ
jgi:hypothetical protein